jgi:hypothetical protein
MSASGEEMLVGGLCLVLALINAWRIRSALRQGEIPLYRKRLRRAETTPAKFAVLVALNLAVVGVLLVIAADLLLGLRLRGH